MKKTMRKTNTFHNFTTAQSIFVCCFSFLLFSFVLFCTWNSNHKWFNHRIIPSFFPLIKFFWAEIQFTRLFPQISDSNLHQFGNLIWQKPTNHDWIRYNFVYNVPIFAVFIYIWTRTHSRQIQTCRLADCRFKLVRANKNVRCWLNIVDTLLLNHLTGELLLKL